MLFIRSLLFNVFGFATVLIAATLLLLTFWAPYRFRWAICVTWCRLAIWSGTFFCGLKVEVEGEENIPDEPSVVLIKHTSTFETVWQVTAFPRSAWVVKRELLWAPLFGWAIGIALKPIAINRSAGSSAVKQVISQGEEKLADGVWITIFPEGTRMPPGETRRYGVSGAALAKEAGCKIVPVAHNAGDFWPRNGFIKRPGTIKVRIGPPIDPSGRPPKETNLIVQGWIESEMQKISRLYSDSTDRIRNARNKQLVQGRAVRNNLLCGITAMLFVLLACSESNPKPVGSADDGSLALISSKTIKEHVTWLADDAREGRMTGEPGYDASAAYVAEQFSVMGLTPSGDNGWYQDVPLIRYRIDVDSTSVVAHRDGSDRELNYREHYGMSADKVRSTTSVRGEVVYVGFGVHAPEYGYSDYDGIDVSGKIVALFDGAPSTLPHAQRAYYASGQTKSEEAVHRGAVASINLRSKRAQERTPWERYRKMTGKRPGMAWVSLTGDASNYFPELRGSATISAETAAELFAGTPISFDEALQAIEADAPATTALGFEISISRNSAHETISSPNVIGMVRGNDAALRNEYVVYTAHLDHTGYATAPKTDDDINNGAYDNAMGVGIMLETARALAANPPARSVLFIALTAEERGLLGSDYFANYPTVPSDNIVANINVDMPLFLYPIADLIAFGSEHSSMESVVEAAAKAEGFAVTPNPLPEENLFVRSDQYSFVRRGVPSIYLIPGFTSADPGIDGEALFRDHIENHYHEPSDDMNRPIDWESVERFTRAKARIGYLIANDEQRPTWKDSDFFGERFARKNP